MSKKIANTTSTIFEQIKEGDEHGNEFWGARKLSKILEHSEFRHFLPVIERAKEACLNSGHSVEDHFEDYLEMVPIGSCANNNSEDLKYLLRDSYNIKNLKNDFCSYYRFLNN